MSGLDFSLLNRTLDSLEAIALRQKAERDTAIALLRESILYCSSPAVSQKVGAFLERVSNERSSH